MVCESQRRRPGSRWRCAGPPAQGVTDLVVELSTARSGTVRDELARVPGDPNLRVDYWSVDAGGYLGGRQELGHRTGAGRHTRRDGGHARRRTVPRAGPRPGGAGRSGYGRGGGRGHRLTTSHAALRDEVSARLSELAASRRRRLVAADVPIPQPGGSVLSGVAPVVGAVGNGTRALPYRRPAGDTPMEWPPGNRLCSYGSCSTRPKA